MSKVENACLSYVKGSEFFFFLKIHWAEGNSSWDYHILEISMIAKQS